MPATTPTLSGPLKAIPLNQASLGEAMALSAIEGDHLLIKRLLGLGIRVGSQLTLTQRRGTGVIVANQGARIALGLGLARRLLVTPLDQA